MKEIVLKRDGGFFVSGGSIVAGDTAAYTLTMDMGEPASSFTAMAVCQENGQYSTDFTVSGTKISCTLKNSMYPEEGYITVRFAVSKGSAVLTAKEVGFSVLAANNDKTLAQAESSNISTIMTAVSDMREAAKGFAKSAQTLAGYGITDAYTKSEIDGKIASVYRYRGSFAHPMVIPRASYAAGDVYNCAYGGYIPQESLSAALTITKVAYTVKSYNNYSVTLTFADDISGKFDYVSDIGLKVAEYTYGDDIFLVAAIDENTPTPSGTTLKLRVNPAKFSDYSDKGFSLNPIDYFLGFTSEYSGSLTSSVFNLWRGSTYGTVSYVGDGGNVAWTGSGWDSLGSGIDTSAFALKSQFSSYCTKSDADAKISAAITSALTSEV